MININYTVLFGICIINFFTVISFIINLCSHYKNKSFVCYMHLVFWIVFNVTILLVAIIPELNKINVIY